MKALVMAGGQGSRLRPLTCDRPKPMVPVLNEPVMAHLLRLLRRVGVEEVIVTLHPMPEMVQERFGDGREFGLRMRYLVEPHPLGTAGSAARALPWLDGTFLVVSGDAFTDIPLEQAVRFHREQGAMATLVLRRVEEPGEYGIVATDAAGRVVRFQEKPCRAELFSNQANTGIYVLEPEVLARLPEGRPVDFSQELFPRLLQEGAALYGWMAREGYWNDVGTPEQYRQTHLDVMARWMEQGAEGVRVGPGCRVAPGARLVPPCQLGPGCEVEDGAEVGPFACLGPQCHVGRGASVRHSVLWQGCWVGPAAEVRGAVLADGVVLGRAARVFEGAVLGRDCRVEEGGVVGPGVRLWPGKQVEAHEHLTRWVVWAGSPLRPAVGPLGVRGLANASLSPELALGMAGAFAGRLAPGTAVVVAHSGQAAARTLAWAAGCGVSAAGCAVLWVDACAAPVARMAVRAAGAGGGVYVAQGGEGGESGEGSERGAGGASGADGECTLMLWDGQGLELAPPELRAVEQAFRRQEWRRAGAEGMGALHSAFALHARAQELYLAALQRWCARLLEAWDAGGAAGEGKPPAETSERAAGELRRRDGGPEVAVEPAGAGPAARVLVQALRTLGVPYRVAQATDRLMHAQPLLLKVALAPAGDGMVLHDSGGRPVRRAVVEDLACLLGGWSYLGEHPVPLPGWAGRAVEERLAAGGRAVRRVPSLPGTVSRHLAGELPVHPLWDGIALACGLAVLARRAGSLQQVVRQAAGAAQLHLELPLRPSRTAGLMDRLAAAAADGGLAAAAGADGIRLAHPQGWAAVRPHPQRPMVQLRVEAASLGDARELADRYARLLEGWQERDGIDGRADRAPGHSRPDDSR